MRETHPKGKREDTAARAKYLTRAANDPGSALVVLRLDELLDAIRSAVGEATGQQDPGSRLCTKERLAEKLGCSTWKIDEMRRSGMPCLYVGDSPRFIYDDVVEWLGAKQPKESV